MSSSGDQALAQQGNKRQDNAGRVTTRVSHKFGFFDLRAIQFRQSVGSFRKQCGRDVLLIPAFVGFLIFKSFTMSYSYSLTRGSIGTS